MSDKIVLMFGDDDIVRCIKEACEDHNIHTSEGYFVVVERTKSRTATLRRWRDKDKEMTRKELYFAVFSGKLEGLTMDERIERYERFRSGLGLPDLDDILEHNYDESDTIVTMVVE